jgi:hypothetical protein
LGPPKKALKILENIMLKKKFIFCALTFFTATGAFAVEACLAALSISIEQQDIETNTPSHPQHKIVCSCKKKDKTIALENLACSGCGDRGRSVLLASLPPQDEQYIDETSDIDLIACECDDLETEIAVV